MAPQVFIIQDNGTRDFSKAREFGELIPMINRDVFPDDVKERVSKIGSIIQAKLKYFNPNTDYILLTGDPVAIILTGMCLMLNHSIEDVNLLKYDRENDAYYEVTV